MSNNITLKDLVELSELSEKVGVDRFNSKLKDALVDKLTASPGLFTFSDVISVMECVRGDVIEDIIEYSNKRLSKG